MLASIPLSRFWLCAPALFPARFGLEKSRLRRALFIACPQNKARVSFLVPKRFFGNRFLRNSVSRLPVDTGRETRNSVSRTAFPNRVWERKDQHPRRFTLLTDDRSDPKGERVQRAPPSGRG